MKQRSILKKIREYIWSILILEIFQDSEMLVKFKEFGVTLGKYIMLQIFLKIILFSFWH